MSVDKAIEKINERLGQFIYRDELKEILLAMKEDSPPCYDHHKELKDIERRLGKLENNIEVNEKENFVRVGTVKYRMVMVKQPAKVEQTQTFEKELISLINKHSEENKSNTPDYILGCFLEYCLLAFNTAVQQRETWYGRDGRPSHKDTISISREVADNWLITMHDRMQTQDMDKHDQELYTEIETALAQEKEGK